MATTYYVATTGSNTNTGAIDQPWLTIQKAATSMIAGDTVLIHAGTYNEKVTPANSGNSSNYITYNAFGDGDVIIDGGGGARTSCISVGNKGYLKFIGLHLQNVGWTSHNALINVSTGGNHIIFDGLLMENAYYGLNLTGNETTSDTPSVAVSFVTLQNSTIRYTKAYGVYMHFKVIDTTIGPNNIIYNDNALTGIPYDENQYGINLDDDYTNTTHVGAKRITIIGNEIYGHAVQGIRPWNSEYILIKNNYVHTNGATAIQIEDNSDYVILDGNRTEDNAQTMEYETGIWVDGSSNAVIQNNYIKGNQIGFHIGSSSNVLARKNVIFNNNRAPSGSNVMGLLVDTSASTITLVHNTAYQNGVSGSRGNLVGCKDSASNIKIVNNVFSESKGTQDGWFDCGISSNYNNFYNTRTLAFTYGGSSKTWTTYKSSSGQDSNSITSNPLFFDVGSTNFSLGSSSPNIDAGSVLTTTVSAGNGTSIPVTDARYFFNGYGLMTGDIIQVGSTTTVVTEVDYVENIITVSPSISWSNGDGVSYAYSGVAPDMGAFEYSSGTTIPPSAPTLNSISIGDSNGFTNDTTPTITLVTSGSPTNIAFSCDSGSSWSAWITYATTISTFNITSGATGCNSTNGSKTIMAKVKNVYDLESENVSDSTYFDNTGPTGSIVNTSGNPTNNATPTLNLNISDVGVGTTGAQMRFSCDNTNWSNWETYQSVKTNFNIKPVVVTYGCDTSDGSRTVYVQYRDLLQNSSSSYDTGSFVLDTSMPMVIPNVPASLAQYKNDGVSPIEQEGFTNENQVVFKFNLSSNNASDALTPQIEIREIGISFSNTTTNSGTELIYSGTPVRGEVTVSGLSSGTNYHWQASASNNTGFGPWLEMAGTIDFGVDTGVPVSGLISYPQGNLAVLSVGLTVDDGISYSGINNSSRLVQRSEANYLAGECGTFGSFNTATLSGTYPNFNDTTILSGKCYKYRYVVTNNAGSQTIYTSTNVIKVDTSGPSVPGTPGTTSPTNNTRPTWTWTASNDNESDLISPAYTIEWSQDNTFISGVSTTMTNTNSYTHNSNLANGTWYFRVKSTNLATMDSSFSNNGQVVIDLSTFGLTEITSTPTENGAYITWVTDRNSSSRVEYGLGESYPYSTTESDTTSRILDHSVTVTNLYSCSTYHYRVISRDVTGNEVVSGQYTLNTAGCTGGAMMMSQTNTPITVSEGGVLELHENLYGIGISVPVAYAGNDANFQIKKLDKRTVISSISTPVGYGLVGNYIYDMKALSDISTSIVSFNAPLTVKIHYQMNELTGVSEEGLKIHRWDGSQWNLLSGCVVNSVDDTIICQTNNFSVFGLFGTSATTPTPTTVPQNNNSGSNNVPSTPAATGCNNQKPDSVPDLFEIRTSKSKATLYYAPSQGSYSSVYIAYSSKPNIWEYGVEQSQNNSHAVTNFTINHLKPNTKYYFKVRFGSGCATGNWSNVMTVKTSASEKQIKSYYKNILAVISATIRNVYVPKTIPIVKKVKTETLVYPTIAQVLPTTVQFVPTKPKQSLPSLIEKPIKKTCILWWCF
ncbi:MAG: right-handed parallel beta-helix repeat-containing protein [Candidatus Shapirobacteria bacterium]